MADFNISLPETLGKYVLNRIEKGDYSNVSDYFRTLARKEKEEQEKSLQKGIIDTYAVSIQRVSSLPISDEEKKRMIRTYMMLEMDEIQQKKASWSDIEHQIELASTEAQKNGLTPEILDSILNEK